MGEHERMKVWMEDGTAFYFVKSIDGTAHFSLNSGGNTAVAYSDNASISSIHAVIGEPLTFSYGLFCQHGYKSDTNVKDIKYDVPYDA